MKFVADDAANLLLRGQLGSFIILTFMHESSHSFAHRLTRNILPIDWLTPDAQGDERGESGALLEERLLRGKLTAVWDGDDVTKLNRFHLIREVWLQPTTGMYYIPFFDIMFAYEQCSHMPQWTTVGNT